MRIPSGRLAEFAAAILEQGGFSAEEGGIIAQSLVLSDLMGHESHGVFRVPSYIRYLEKGRVVSGAELRVVHETETALTVDAQRGPGQVQVPRLLSLLAPRAEKHGMATGAVRACGHTGRVGEWVEWAAARGFAALMMVNDNGEWLAVAPPGGKSPCTSTNPLAFGIPLADGRVFSADFSTASIAHGKARVARASGKQLAPGLIQDAHGRPSTDPEVLFGDPPGSILPMGGYKGFALSMFIDCIVAGLSGGLAPPGPTDGMMSSNAVICLWDPGKFAGLAHMREQAEKYLGFVRATPLSDPASPIRIPGERAQEALARNGAEGILLEKGTREVLCAEARKWGIPLPDGLA